MSNSETAAGYRPGLTPILIGAAAGSLFYLVIALGLLTALWGPKGFLIPGDAAESVIENGYWIGRVMGSWVNLFSFIAFGIAVALLLSRSRQIQMEERSFSLDLLGADDDSLLLPDDALEIRKRLKYVDEKTQRTVLLQLLSAGLQRARANWSAGDCGEAIKTQTELIQGQVEASYSIIRYLAWAIPSIGFIGTVLGIGYAMGALQGAKGENMLTEAAKHLSMAFDTTFVALVLSLILMFLLHRVQAADDGFLVRATDWCMRRFVFRMHITE